MAILVVYVLCQCEGLVCDDKTPVEPVQSHVQIHVRRKVMHTGARIYALKKRILLYITSTSYVVADIAAIEVTFLASL